MSVVGFLHTSAVHRPVFETLVAEISPGAATVSDVGESLLVDARSRGIDDAAVVAGVRVRLNSLADAGAERIVCTCSTIGGLAEQLGDSLGLSVVRVDRAMAERAIEIGGRIAVVAAVESTLAPTIELLKSVAADRSSDAEITIVVADGAWERFEAGDMSGYHRSIADVVVAQALLADVVVLAQASMAGAAEIVDVPAEVLSSPRLAVERMFVR